MKNKQKLITIIKFLSKNDFYYCAKNGELYNIGNGEMCYCADDIYQEAHDDIYVALVELFNGFRIDTNKALTEEFRAEILELASEKADENHYYFNTITKKEALQIIQDNEELKQILTERFTFSAHK